MGRVLSIFKISWQKISREINVLEFSSRRKAHTKYYECSHRNSKWCNKYCIGVTKDTLITCRHNGIISQHKNSKSESDIIYRKKHDNIQDKSYVPYVNIIMS